jgi:hypothetical protein
MITFEKKASSSDLHPSMSMIELFIPLIEELVCLDIDRTFLFRDLHIGHLCIGSEGMIDNEKDKNRTVDEPAISHVTPLGWK